MGETSGVLHLPQDEILERWEAHRKRQLYEAIMMRDQWQREVDRLSKINPLNGPASGTGGQ